MSAPLSPRDYGKLPFATTSNNALGGSPTCGTVINNTLVYPYGGYVQGTDAPTLRIFDGTTDHLLATIPANLTGVVCQAVVSMIAANGVIYLSTIDTGSDHTNWEGRVFQLNPDSGDLTQLGARFTGGNVPYALAWHMGRLWVGTNTGNTADGYSVYFFRPDVDTAWTLDTSVAGAGFTSGIASMISFQGNLLIGLSVGSGGAGARGAYVYKRDNTGAYTNISITLDTGATVDTGSAWDSMCVFNGFLYLAYFGGVSGTKKSMIRKWDGSSVSTVYNGASTTIIPYVQMFVDIPTSTMYVIGGGPSGLTVKQAVLLSTTNGTSYTDLSAQLLGAATALPLHAVLAL